MILPVILWSLLITISAQGQIFVDPAVEPLLTVAKPMDLAVMGRHESLVAFEDAGGKGVASYFDKRTSQWKQVASQLVGPTRVAFNPRHREIFVSESNRIFIYGFNKKEVRLRKTLVMPLSLQVGAMQYSVLRRSVFVLTVAGDEIWEVSVKTGLASKLYVSEAWAYKVPGAISAFLVSNDGARVYAIKGHEQSADVIVFHVNRKHMESIQRLQSLKVAWGLEFFKQYLVVGGAPGLMEAFDVRSSKVVPVHWPLPENAVISLWKMDFSRVLWFEDKGPLGQELYEANISTQKRK